MRVASEITQPQNHGGNSAGYWKAIRLIVVQLVTTAGKLGGLPSAASILELPFRVRSLHPQEEFDTHSSQF